MPWVAVKFARLDERLAPREVRQPFDESWHEENSEDTVVTVVG